MTTTAPFDPLALASETIQALHQVKADRQGLLGADDGQYARLLQAGFTDDDFSLLAENAGLGICALDLLDAIDLLDHGAGAQRSGRRPLRVDRFVALRKAQLSINEIGFCLIFDATPEEYRQAAATFQERLAAPGVLTYLSHTLGARQNAAFFQILGHTHGWEHGGVAVQGFLRHAFSRLGIANPDPVEPDISLQRGVEPLFDDMGGSLWQQLARERLFHALTQTTYHVTSPAHASQMLHGGDRPGGLSWRRLWQPFDGHYSPTAERDWIARFGMDHPATPVVSKAVLVEDILADCAASDEGFDLRAENKAIERAITHRKGQFDQFIEMHGNLIEWLLETVGNKQHEPLWRFAMAEKPDYLKAILGQTLTALDMPEPSQVFIRKAPTLVEGSSQQQFDTLTAHALGHIFYARVLVLFDMCSRGMMQPGNRLAAREILTQWDGRLSHLGSGVVPARESGMFHARTKEDAELFSLVLDATPAPLALKGYTFRPSSVAAHISKPDLDHMAWNHAVVLTPQGEPANHEEWNRLRGLFYADFALGPTPRPSRRGRPR